MSSHNWRHQEEVGSVFSLKIITWVALSLGRFPARVLLVFVALYFLIMGKNARVASKDYLYRALNRKPKIKELFLHFYYFSSVTLDRLFLLAGKFSRFDIETRGQEIFQRLKNDNQGCLLFVSHMGSFDVMRALGAKTEALPISILMDTEHNARVMQVMSQMNPELASRIINARQHPSQLVIKLNEVVSEGGMVGVMVDRLQGQDSGIDCKLLDGNIKLPAGPWQLAAALKVPVVICFGLYLGGNKYRLYFERLDPADLNVRREREKKIAKLIQDYCHRLEHYISIAPYNWFNFYKFWN